MRILHIITGLAAGGAEQQLRLMIRHLPERHRCEVVTLENPGTVADGLRADGVKVVHLGMRGNRDLAALPRLTRLIRDGGYDLVHCHLYRACVYGRIAARLAGVRAVVATEHSLTGAVLEGRRVTRGVRGLYLATERLGRSTVAVSATVAAHLADWGVPERRVRVIPNGLDASRYEWPAAERAALRLRLRGELGLPQQSFVIGGLGRLVPGKCFEVLIDALAALPGDTGDGTRLLLVGEGPARAALEARARRAGVADRVVLTGERDDVPELFTAMDVLAAPSAAETFGLALLEGLAAGLPVRWSSGPALAELPPEAAPSARWTRSDPAAYAAEFRELQHRTRGETIPAARPEAVGHYDIARLALDLSALYEELDAASAPIPAPLTAKDSSHVRQ